jgi:hypothetical protein
MIKPFTIRFPERNEWKQGFQLDRKGGLIWYTDGSKAKKGTGTEVHCLGTRRELSFPLGNTQRYSRLKYTPSRHVQSRI